METRGFQAYKAQSVSTMTQGEQLLLLYDELVKRLTRAELALDKEDYTVFEESVDRYAGTTGATKGVLIEKAGSTLAPTSIYSNTWQSAIDDLDDEIEKWQDKLSDKIDYYTTQFTNLETLISEMNSQSSMLSSLSGGY
jgi:flagellar capping protein FliD